MKNRMHFIGKTAALLAGLILCLGMTAMAAPSIEGETSLQSKEDEVVSAEYTITSDGEMENAELTLLYDKDVLTYMSGSGGNNFSGSGGNGSVQLSSRPNASEAVFTVKFKGKSSEDTDITIASCVITVDGKQIDVLSGEETSAAEVSETDSTAEEDEDNEERASFVIDGRTFYVRRPDDVEGFDTMHLDIQGYDCRVLKHQSLDLYVVKLRSDNGSYRDNFVYNPETGNVIPFVQMESGTDDVIFIEPEENVHVPTRYSPVNMGWGPKYTIPAYKHVTIDGIDEIQDDTNRYLVYGINQDGEKAWYSYDYDRNSLQLFDDVAYQGEQNYIAYLEESVEGQKEESAHLLERYNTDMGRRLTIIMVMTILIIVLLNAVFLMYHRMKKMQVLPDGEDEEEPEEKPERKPGAFVTGSLEENETDFQEPGEEEPEEEIELEIIDLDDETEDED